MPNSTLHTTMLASVLTNMSRPSSALANTSIAAPFISRRASVHSFAGSLTTRLHPYTHRAVAIGNELHRRNISSVRTYRASSSVVAAPSCPSLKPHFDYKWIAANAQQIQDNIALRKCEGDVSRVSELYDTVRVDRFGLEQLKKERNKFARNMKESMKHASSAEEKQSLVGHGKQLKQRIAATEAKLNEVEAELEAETLKLPNIAHEDVPEGEPVLVKYLGSKPTFNGFEPKSHLELGEPYGMFDFEAGSRAVGSHFAYLRNEAALLELALISWTMQEAVHAGFTPILTPDLVQENVSAGCGFQPRGGASFQSQVYTIEGTGQCLAGTAEVTLAGMLVNRTVLPGELPIRTAAFSHCFRTETGSVGMGTQGIYRMHQFSKVELFTFSHPSESQQIHQDMVDFQEHLFSSLGLHCRMLNMPFDELGAPAYRKIDIEAWMPGRGEFGEYGEISSASHCTDYQSRRLNIRFNDSDDAGRAVYLHTLNATACAVPRTLIAILEQNQQADGSISIPSVLRPFMGNRDMISPTNCLQHK
jgi:seryl-tRNA synthetase